MRRHGGAQPGRQPPVILDRLSCREQRRGPVILADQRRRSAASRRASATFRRRSCRSEDRARHRHPGCACARHLIARLAVRRALQTAFMRTLPSTSTVRCRAGWSAAGTWEKASSTTECRTAFRTSMMSARLPGVSEPMRSPRPSTRAAVMARAISRRGVSSGRPGRTGGRAPARREAAFHGAVEIALHVEQTPAAPAVRRHGAECRSRHQSTPRSTGGARHRPRALGVGRGREASACRRRHALELGIADQVAGDHQQSGPSTLGCELVYGAGLVDVDAAWCLEVAREGELPLQARCANRFDAEADGGEALGIVEFVVDAPAVRHSILRPRELVGCRRHERIGEEMADAGLLNAAIEAGQKRDCGCRGNNRRRWSCRRTASRSRRSRRR